MRDVKESKLFLAHELGKLGIQCLLGQTNFIHLKFPSGYDLKSVEEKMKQRGYLVRASGNGLPAVIKGCLRITVGPPDQMKEFLKVFKELVSSSSNGISTNKRAKLSAEKYRV